ncbi:Fibrocystin-L [Tupaia chinensis]|uniref:Fibrocystin-L n=1 Tax=Tupaia chinensis TaxID=246437 RepID=L8Y443_TUPCH|nr:Fibrocystin-L [Tupaia chinensis]
MGSMTCKMTGTYIGHHNVSFILDSDYGRYYIEILLQEYRLSAFVDVGLYQYTNVYTEQQTGDAVNEEQVIKSQSTVIQEVQFQAAVEEMVSTKCPPQIAGVEEGFVVKYFRDYETDFDLELVNRGQKTAETDAYCGRYSLKNPAVLFDSADVKPNRPPYGDILLFPYNQVEVYVNGIPAKCSGDCGFTWDPRKTPLVLATSPSQGNEIKCQILNGSAGHVPVAVSMADVGLAQNVEGERVHFLYQSQISHTWPASGSLAGGTLLTISGFGFNEQSKVLVGNETCNVIEGDLNKITCRTPKITIGSYPCVVEESSDNSITCHIDPQNSMDVGIREVVTLTVYNLGIAISTLSDEFDRRFVLLPHIAKVLPSAGSTTGMTRVIIEGSGFAVSPAGVQVLMGHFPCKVLSVNYTAIECETSPAPQQLVAVDLLIHGVPAQCQGNCSFSYLESIAPCVTGVFPNSIKGSGKVLIEGEGFGSILEEIAVFIGNQQLRAIDVNENNITVLVTPLPAGLHSLSVVVGTKGLARGNLTVNSPAVASVSPASGSIGGGTTLVITGNGFYPGTITVTVGDNPCQIISVNSSNVYCHTSAGAAGMVVVKIFVNTIAYPPLSFTYALEDTPFLRGIVPNRGPPGTEVEITGSNFGTDIMEIVVMINNAQCALILVNDSAMRCIVGEHAGGTFPVMMHRKTKGSAVSTVVFEYPLNIQNIHPSQGKGPEQACEVSVVNGKDLSQSTTPFTYTMSLTPLIFEISPKRGSTAGGTRLTVMGSGFSENMEDVQVAIAEAKCDVEYSNKTHIICMTSAHTPSGWAPLHVHVSRIGRAKVVIVLVGVVIPLTASQH